MNNYFRITAMFEDKNFCFILDSNGMFEKLWQFSSYLVSKGLKVLEVSKLENIIDVNIEPVEKDNKHIFLMATMHGKPKRITQTIDGETYNAIQVADKIYVPDKTQIIQQQKIKPRVNWSTPP